MAGRTLMTLDVRELVRRLRAGEPDRAIARDLSVARKTVARYRALAQDRGWLDGPMMALEELEAKLRPCAPERNLPPAYFKAEPYRERILALRQKGLEVQAIFQQLGGGKDLPVSRSSLYRYVQHLEGPSPEAFVRIETAPGEQAQVDFGSAGEMVSPITGEVRKVYFFVMTLSYSRHMYLRFVFDQKVETWLRCHREAFEYFGGVVKKVVIDNLKAAIVKAVLHDPVAQRSYREFAEHYGFLISPCRPKTPRHKGKVESGVHYVARNFLAGRELRDLTELNRDGLIWVEKVAGIRIHGTIKDRPLARFLQVEKAALLPLPSTPYDLGVWKQAKLHPDCHVVVEGAYYSAPHRLIGRTLWIRSNRREVILFHEYERVATHLWGPPGTRRTNQAHYPPEKVAFLMATPQWCQQQAALIGSGTSEVIGRYLNERPLDRLRTAQAILRLGQKHGPPRLEAACRRALCFEDVRYGTLKRILDRSLESEPLPEFAPARPRREYLFARSGSEIFS
jgi:hypothetical protein